MPEHRRRMRYEVTVHNQDGECISDAIILGPSGLADEIENLPMHSTIKIVRVGDWVETNQDG